MICIVYASSAVKLLTKEDLEAILQKSRVNNKRDGITGMLLYKDGCIIQALEGKEEMVKATHERIMRDPRHHNIITMLKIPIEERQFSQWSMGCPDLDKVASATAPEVSQFLSNHAPTPEFYSAAPGRALKLLTTFRETMR